MWFWIILAIVISKNTITSYAGPVDTEYSDIPDDASLLYMDEGSLNDQPSDDNEIEARRRSALDKNFMRFGRGDTDLLPPSTIQNDDDDLDYEKFNRPARTNHKTKNIVRFGRGKTADFIRFGRSYLKRGQDKNFIRFGRFGVPTKRTRRDAPRKKDHKNMFRFGRNDNFMRFGRMPIYDNNVESRNNMSAARELLENFSHHSVPNLFPLLQQLVQRLRNETKCYGCARLT